MLPHVASDTQFTYFLMAVLSMADNPLAGRNYGNRDIALSLSQAIGVEQLGHASLASAFYEGLQPIVAGMEAGDLTEAQASLLIELLLAAYTEATINGQIETLLQGLSDSLLAGMSGRENG
jgi:hypothetical protein